MKKYAKLLLAMVLTALLTVAVSAGTLNFELPKDAYGEDPEVTIDVYKGILAKCGDVLSSAVKKGTLTEVRKDAGASMPMPTEPGLYTVYVHGEGYYYVAQALNLTEEDLAAGTKTLTLHGGKMAGNGYEPCKMLSDAPDGVTRKNVDLLTILPSEEVLQLYTVEPQNYNTPAFREGRAVYQITTQDEMMAFIAECVSAGGNLHQYSVGTSDIYKFDMPMVVATKSEIAENATIEDAAKILRENGKPTVWLEGSIHANESASGESCLVFIDKLAHDEKMIALLDQINVVVVPRISTDSSYLFMRTTAGGYDPNRDHVELKDNDLLALHIAWRKFLPEVTVDLHEFNAYNVTASTGKNASITDVETTPFTSLNVAEAVTELSYEMTAKAFEDATAAGLRITHYGTAKYPAVGRGFFGTYGGVSILVESRGIGFGREIYERRVFSHETVCMAYLQYVADNAEKVRDAVKTAREEMTEGRKTYQEDKVLVLSQSASGRKTTPYASTTYGAKMDGVPYVTKENKTLNVMDTANRSRSYPTAYVIPADAANIDRILAFLDKHELEYFKLDAGATAELQQYYYVREGRADGKTIGVEADLRAAASVSFPNGAYLFPMDQIGSQLLALIFEPDVWDYGENYLGTLVTLELMDKDGENNYPLYRYTGNDPRSAFGITPTEAEAPTAAESGANTVMIASIAGGAVLIAAAVVIVMLKKKGEKKA